MSFELFCLAALSFQIAHSHIAVKFSQSEISPLLFSALKKARKIYLHLLVAFSCYLDSITKTLVICQALFLAYFKTTKLRLVNHYTTSIAYLFKFVKNFLANLGRCFKNCLVYCKRLPYYIPLDFSSRSRPRRPKGKGKLYIK